jgi:uncharacterized membrane protein YgcG
VGARRRKEGQSQRAQAQPDTQLAALQAANTRLEAAHAAQARELAQAQTEAASYQAEITRVKAAHASAVIGHAWELAQVQTAGHAQATAMQGQLRSRDTEITELKRALVVHAGGADVDSTDGGGGTGGGGGGGGYGSSAAAAHQALHQVKQETPDLFHG